MGKWASLLKVWSSGSPAFLLLQSGGKQFWATMALLQRPAITGHHPRPGQPVLQASAVLESKGIAGLGLGLETFRHLLGVWKRALEDASVILIFALSTWRGTEIGSVSLVSKQPPCE